MNAATTARNKFRELLLKLFQFENADLDFGIYRIMNHKRNVIEAFIDDDLESLVENALSADDEVHIERLKNLAVEIKEIFGGDALDVDGNLKKQFHDTPKGKEYLSAQKSAANRLPKAQVEESAFNYLYDFFARYYEEGDFISKRRYSRKQRYAIPYNGEEVHLTWANRDQYYIKTGEYFPRYEFRCGDYNVRFELRDADVEQDNRKGAKRYFFPLHKEVHCDGKQITVPFHFRPLRENEKFSGNAKQEEILSAFIARLAKKIAPPPPPVAAALFATADKGEGELTVLESHMRRYARRNTADYFIHKNLHGFLTQELDYYIKNEVLSLDDLDKAGEFAANGHFQLMQVVRKIGTEIILFLTQIENFQKQLFEKKKFVIDTHYCVALGRIEDTSLRRIILGNAKQWAEWSAMSGEKLSGEKQRQNFLRDNPTLMVDTVHFDADFKDNLLAQFADIDGDCDGVLLSGENFQGLNLLADKYRESVKCVYIDPPYNTKASEIIYKNGYKHSSWMTLLENRIVQSMQTMSDESVFIAAIDDAEMVNLCHVLEICFPTRDRHVVVVNHHPAGAGLGDTNISRTHEYAIFLTPQDLKILRGAKKEAGKIERGFMRAGMAENKLRTGRPNSFYAILVNPKTSEIVGAERPPPLGKNYPKENTSEGWLRIYPVSKGGIEHVWVRSYESFLREHAQGTVICKNAKSIYQIVDHKGKRRQIFSNWTDKKYNAGVYGTRVLANIIGEAGVFSYPKSIHNVEDCVMSCTHDDDEAIILDFFAGSGTTGHAVINLNREDGGRRKFILMEMGEYFDSVLLPRLKRIAWTPQWKDGKPKRAATAEETDRAPRIFKYQRLESYEDALENISFVDDNSAQSMMKFPDYLLNYMLKWETRDSQTLLNVKNLQAPFNYKLRLRRNGVRDETPVDVPETFNYLLGLQVKTRKVHTDGKRRYLVYTGHTKNRPTTIIWRNTEGWTDKDFERERDFVATKNLTAGAEMVYVNSDSLIPGAWSLDSTFAKSMSVEEKT